MDAVEGIANNEPRTAGVGVWCALEMVLVLTPAGLKKGQVARTLSIEFFGPSTGPADRAGSDGVVQKHSGF